MRTLPSRPDLPKAVAEKLVAKTEQIAKASDPKADADRVFSSSRGAKWFRPVVESLGKMAGPGERCMWCSGSESSDVEHYRPKAEYPLSAMTWENMLWSCGICNRHKGDRFPADPHRLLDPTCENVWSFLFIDEFGNLIARFRIDLNALDPRADATLKTMKLDRQALQESRLRRRRELVRHVEDSLARYDVGQVTVEQLRDRVREWREAPFQPDVADYHLNGPGRTETPFSRLFDVIERATKHPSPPT